MTTKKDEPVKLQPGEPEPLHRLRYLGGLDAVEENGQVVRKGDEVDVPVNRAADLLEHDPPDWESADGKHDPKRVTVAAEEPPKGG
jgi:hypothetical protein